MSAVQHPLDGEDSRIRVHRMPGASTFELRATGLALTNSPYVAITEDHAGMAPGWVQAILDGHARHPTAAALVGPVVNGAPRRRSSRAHHVYLFGDCTPPLRPDPLRVLPLANISLNRNVLDGLARAPPPFWLECTAIPAIRDATVFVPDMVGIHAQDFTAFQAARAHYHNARSVAAAEGCPKRLMASTWWLHRALADRVRRTRQQLRSIQPPVGPVASRFLLLPIRWANFFGTVLGWVRGPGVSPAKVH